MGLLSWLSGASHSDDYNAGYSGGDEFLDLVEYQEPLTDEEANAQWDAVESGHSQEYVSGFANSMKDNASFWGRLFG